MIFFDGPSGEYGFLSNNRQESFTVGTMIFSTVTKYLMYCKSRMFDDRETTQKIFNEWDPRMIAAYGRNVQGVDEAAWNARLPILLYRGLKAKYDQNPQLVTKLVETGNEMLVYLGPDDPVLGIGLYSSSEERFDRENWKGQNLLGFALMDLRESYQFLMPDGLRRKIQGKLGKGSRADLTGALHGEDFGKWDEISCRYPPYEGEDPYIYLNYSLADIKTAFEMAELLNRLGFHVWYDRFLTDGRLWTPERSDAVERCAVFLDIENGEKHVSHVRHLARSFAELLDIPVLDACMYHKYKSIFSRKKEEAEKEKEQENGQEKEQEKEELTYIDVNKKDVPLEEQCLMLLEKNGLRPGMKNPDGTEKPEPRFDLILCYYKDYGGDRSWFKHTDWYRCNLRTREVHYSSGERSTVKGKPPIRQGRFLDPRQEPLFLSEEEVYRASVWKCREFLAKRKSTEPDYIGTPEDWAFSARLARLKGEIPEKIAAEYRAAKERLEQSERDYPYMDEFEYLSSHFDE